MIIRPVCSRRGTHRQVTMPQSFQLFTSADWVKFDGWLEIEDGTVSVLKDPYRFWCRRCGRETRMKAKTLRKALNAVAHVSSIDADAYNVLDVSLLPF